MNDSVVPESGAFVSYSYEDSNAIDILRSALPDNHQITLFAPIMVEPHETVGAPIIDAIKNSSGLICLDTPDSRTSFWVTFERETALSLGLPTYAFDPARRAFRRVHVQPPPPAIYPLFDSRHSAAVSEMIDWILHDRGLPLDIASGIHSMSDLDIWTDEFEGVFIAFVTRCTAATLDMSMMKWKCDRYEQRQPRLIVASLDAPAGGWLPPQWRPYMLPDDVSVVDLTDAGAVTPYAKKRLDDLVVRAHWIFHMLRIGPMGELFLDDFP